MSSLSRSGFCISVSFLNSEAYLNTSNDLRIVRAEAFDWTICHADAFTGSNNYKITKKIPRRFCVEFVADGN